MDRTQFIADQRGTLLVFSKRYTPTLITGYVEEELKIWTCEDHGCEEFQCARGNGQACTE